MSNLNQSALDVIKPSCDLVNEKLIDNLKKVMILIEEANALGKNSVSISIKEHDEMYKAVSKYNSEFAAKGYSVCHYFTPCVLSDTFIISW